MFRKEHKKYSLALVLGAFILGVLSMTFADREQAESYHENAKEIRVLKQENVSEGDWAYKSVTDVAALAADCPEPMTAVFDSDSGLYKITSAEELYLARVSDRAFQPMEKSVVYDTGDLRRVSERYDLTEIESKNLAGFMSQCPGNQIIVYAPPVDETLGEYKGKKCRLVCMTATDDQLRYNEIRKGITRRPLGYNAVVLASSLLGTKVNMGITIANAASNWLGIDFGVRSDSTSSVTKKECVTFQYLDFYERDSAYKTRGITSYGTIALTTTIKHWVKQPNGDFINEAIIGEPVGGFFGQVYSLEALADKCWIYVEGIGDLFYKDYARKFKLDEYNSIPAIQPRRNGSI